MIKVTACACHYVHLLPKSKIFTDWFFAARSDYQYSNTLVYNNFPWPNITDEGIAVIEKQAQAVLDARSLYSDSSLADLYDPLTMPPDLLKAHRALDAAVMKLYGFSVKDTTEAACVAALMEMYQKLVAKSAKNHS